LVAYDDQTIGPFLWGSVNDALLTPEGFLKEAEKQDPLRLFRLIYRLLVQHQRTGDPRALATAVSDLNFMMDTYQPADRTEEGYHWLYGFDYEGIKAPWWSGMEGFFAPMTLYAGWQATGDQRYRDAAIKSAKRMLKDPTQGGALWRKGDACWISEYSWDGITDDKEFHVLNGHLWGLQALYMLAEASQDDELKEAYQCARKGTIDRLAQHYNVAGNWTWYQTDPKVINPTHYHIIELMQFNAMALLTEDPAYTDGARRRSDIFKGAYPLHLVKTPAGYEIQLALMGAPNPYWADNYQMIVRCDVVGQTVEKRLSAYDRSLPWSERLVLRMPVSAVPRSCSVSTNSTLEVGLYDQSTFDVETATERDAVPLKARAEINAGEGGNSSIFRIEVARQSSFWKRMIGKIADHPKDESHISIDINRPMGILDTLALVVHPGAKVQLGAVFTDADGNSAFRYYPDLVADVDNLVVLNTIGFERGDRLGPNIKQLTLHFYTRDVEEDFNVSIKDVEVMRSPAAIGEYMREHSPAYFPQQ
jgi:hypothetical protein